MNCPECERLRQALGRATDAWIRADHAGNNRLNAQGDAARAKQALADHEATHRTGGLAPANNRNVKQTGS